MRKDMEVGDIVSDSGMGAGTITGFSERGFPMVNNVTCAWVEFEGGGGRTAASGTRGDTNPAWQGITIKFRRAVMRPPVQWIVRPLPIHSH